MILPLTDLMTKVCTRCHIEKDISEFYRNKRNKSGRSPCCKICYRVYAKRYQAKDKYKESQKKYRSSEKGSEARRKWNRSEKQKEYHRIYDRKWRQTDKGRANIAKEAARRRELKRTPNRLTGTQWKEIKEFYNNQCVYCGKGNCVLEIDHYVPLSKGGTHIKDNVVPACHSCNSGKCDRHPLRLFR